MWIEYVIRKIFGYKGPELRNYFDDIELEKVIPKLLQYAFTQIKCDNVVWCLADEFERVQSSNDDTNPLVGAALVDRHIKVQSLHLIEMDQLFRCLTKFTHNLTLPQSAAADSIEHQNILIPILSNKNNSVVAYLLFVNVMQNDVEKSMLRITKDLSYMQKHICFSLQYWQATQMSLHDDLTSLYNQKYMGTVLETEISRAQREKSKFTVLFIDVDYFKSVNDNRGHMVGSRLLIEIANIIKNSIRRCDYAFRYGGDEFVVVLPQTDAEKAVPIAERLRESIEKTDFIIEGQKIHLTLSVGIACYPDHAQTYKDIIRMADEAMYMGKHKSRNIVFVAS